MFAAGYNGRFGAVLVQADESAAAAAATVELDIAELFDGEFELGVRVDFSRPTGMLPLLNQDVAAYAPDNPSLPTVRGFEATPITVGVRNPMIGALRGFSAVIYGLQHDLNPPWPARCDRRIAAGHGRQLRLDAVVQPRQWQAAIHRRRCAGALLHQPRRVPVRRRRAVAGLGHSAVGVRALERSCRAAGVARARSRTS